MSLSADTQFRMRSDESSVQRSVGAERPDPSSDVVKEFRRAMDTQTGAQNAPSQNAPQRQGESVDSLFRNFGGFEEAARREGLRAGAECAGKQTPAQKAPVRLYSGGILLPERLHRHAVGGARHRRSAALFHLG